MQFEPVLDLVYFSFPLLISVSSNDLINGGILCLEMAERVVHDAKLGGSVEEL